MSIKRILKQMAVVALVVLCGCATLPTGPSVLVLPARGKSLERFQAEDLTCRKWAGQQLGMTAQDTADNSTARGAVVGTAIGASAGALLGSASGNAGAGMALGAGSGLLLGTATGAGAGEQAGWEAQRRYDYSYVQCMYIKGNQVPNRVHKTGS